MTYSQEALWFKGLVVIELQNHKSSTKVWSSHHPTLYPRYQQIHRVRSISLHLSSQRDVPVHNSYREPYFRLRVFGFFPSWRFSPGRFCKKLLSPKPYFTAILFAAAIFFSTSTAQLFKNRCPKCQKIFIQALKYDNWNHMVEHTIVFVISCIFFFSH